MLREREVVPCTKSDFLKLLAVSFPHSAAAKKAYILRSICERMICMIKTNRVKLLTYGALLIAVNIVITRIFAINIGVVRISFTFVPQVLGSMLFGPWIGAALALIADVLGQLMTGGMPWLGFCISTVIYGISYGAFLYKRPKTYKNIIICVLLQQIFVDAILGSLWFYHYMGTPFLGALAARSIDAVAMIPVKIFVIKYIWKLIGEKIKI